MMNEYNGCKTSKKFKLNVLDNDTSVSPKQFFEKYISTRTPVIFNSQLSDPTWKADQWSNQYFRSKVPEDELLKIEFRNNSTETYGKGNEMHMNFHTFLNKLESKEENLYLTTQELEYDEEGQPYIMTAPILFLKDDFPIVPRLFQNLIIANINLWYGQSSQETTSGLHHDYHDNLYIILKGEKTITLYSPNEAPNLYTVGNLAKIHPNGRINYEEGLTHADGRDLKADKAFQASLKLEEIANKMENKKSQSNNNTNKKTAEEEEEEENTLKIHYNESDDEIDEALDAVLDAEMGSDFDDESEDDDEDEEEDFEDEEQQLDEDDDEEEEEQEPEEKGEAKRLDSRKRKSNLTEEQDGRKRGKKEQKKGPPSNFSQVDSSLPLSELKKKFPLFPAAQERSVTVTIKAGQMLYIPCGWFHEVRSKGNDGHMALNYWFHPSDQNDFTHPYQSEFWPKNWESRKNNPCRR
jgi:mannose-6-phosphate isomerase-like protein (cupin superfamily)